LAATKLYIYDSTSDADTAQADGRFDEDEVYTVAVPSKEELIRALDRLVARRAFFNRVLVQTHGEPGCIKFNGLRIYDTTLRDSFAARNYHTLFPMYTRIYFDGCNVAGGSMGTEFFQKVGQIFLKIAGGEVFGYTSPGYGVSGWVPFIGGHTMHFSGELKKLYFAPGGTQFTPPAPTFPDDSRYRRDYIGHNI
jgi:Domain of unknown function (DUF4347)